jgi:hypothetical protein
MTSFMSEPAGAPTTDAPPFHAVRIDQVRRLCRDAASIDRPFELERWTSSVLGRIWVRRAPVKDLPDEDLMLVVGKPILDACLSIGGRQGKIVLSAIAQMDRGQLGVVARVLADALPKARLPRWMPDVGNAPIVRAFSADSPGDGEAVLLHADRGQGDSHMIATWIDEPLGRVVKWVQLLRVVDPNDPEIAGEDRLHFREVDPTLTARRVAAAIERTDAILPPFVGDEFSGCRALAIARVTPQPAKLTHAVAS